MPARDIVGQDPWIRRTILGPRSLAERVWRVKERLLPTAQFGAGTESDIPWLI